MKKQFLLSTLAVLAIFSLSSFSTASTGTYGFIWQQCTHTYIQGNFEIQANVGSTYVVISFSIPASSFEYTVFGCTAVPISAAEISLYAKLSAPYQPITTSKAIDAVSGTYSFLVQTKTCYWTGHIEECSPPQNYPLKFNNQIVVSFYAVYGNTFAHGLTETLIVGS